MLNQGCRLKMRWCVFAIEFPWWVRPFNIGDGIGSEGRPALCTYLTFSKTEK